MFEELERCSLLEKKAVQHPYISFVYNKNKEYFCLKHPELVNLNRGSMRQHIQGKQHGLEFDTGKPLAKTKKMPIDVEERAKELANQELSKKDAAKSDPFMQLVTKLRLIFLQQNPAVAFLLAKHGLEGELRDDVLEWVQMGEFCRGLEEENKAKSSKKTEKSMPNM